MKLPADLRGAIGRALNVPGRVVSQGMIRRRLRQGAALEFLSPGQVVIGRILALAPHPDDEVLGCGGLLGALEDARERTTVVWITSGEQGMGGEANRLGQTREDEAVESARRLGLAEFRFMRVPDGAVRATRWAAGALAGMLRETRPDTIILPHPLDPHPDHRATARLLVAALSILEPEYTAQPRILAYSVEALLAPYWMNVVVDTSRGVSRRRLAMAAHSSQGAISDAYATRFEWLTRVVGGCYGVEAGECYWLTDPGSLAAECDRSDALALQRELGRWGAFRQLPAHLLKTRRAALRHARDAGSCGTAQAAGNPPVARIDGTP